MSVRDAALVLADGSTFEGEWFGAEPAGGVATGEVVFNTALTGYQEIITDPSYAGQIVTFTYPHIGNYGVAAEDDESRRPFCRGVIVRDLARRRSSWRSDGDLPAFLERHGVPGIGGIDTRRLTRIIRDSGAIPGAFGPLDLVDEVTLKAAAAVGAGHPRRRPRGPGHHARALHPRRRPAEGGGLRLRHQGVDPRAARASSPPSRSSPPPPAPTSSARWGPTGYFLSNGPGDPEVLDYAAAEIRRLLEDPTPLFGICLGHQVLGLAAGARTVKLPFGHHGGNHPVRDVTTGRIDITSQNHNFAVDPDSLRGIAEMTHVNLNDGVCEGMRLTDANAWSVQHHPEAGPGPHDARHLFEDFKHKMEQQ